MVGAIIAGGIAMGGGLLTVAWRLGRMEQAIHDLQRAVFRNGRRGPDQG